MWLYKLTNKLSGKAYIGTSVNPISYRVSRHLYASKQGQRNSAIACAIRSYGIDKFSVECIGLASSYEELMKMEIEAIASQNTLIPNGYNITIGGRGCYGRKMSEKTKSLIAQRHLGKKPWNYRLKTGPLSESLRQKLSEIRKGRKAWNRGISHTPEHCRKISNSHRHRINPYAKPIEFNGSIYGSIAAAGRANGLSLMQIRYKIQKGKAKFIERTK